MTFPNDRDGGALRTAGIKQIERKLAMAKEDGNAKMVEKFESQLAEYKNAAVVPAGSSIVLK